MWNIHPCVEQLYILLIIKIKLVRCPSWSWLLSQSPSWRTTPVVIVIYHSLDSVSICHVFDHACEAEKQQNKNNICETCEIDINNSIKCNAFLFLLPFIVWFLNNLLEATLIVSTRSSKWMRTFVLVMVLAMLALVILCGWQPPQHHIYHRIQHHHQ